MFISSVSDLTSSAVNLIATSRCPASTVSEWAEFFASGIYSVLFAAYVNLAYADDSDYEHRMTTCSNLGLALLQMPDEQLFEHSLPPKFNVDDVDCDANFPEKLLFLLNHLCPLISAADAPKLQSSAFSLLLRVMDRLVSVEEKQAYSSDASAKAPAVVTKDADAEEDDKVEDDDDTDTDTDDDDNDYSQEVRELPRRLDELLKSTGPTVKAMFSDFDFGERVPPLPADAPASNMASAFLLTWKLVLRLMSGCGAGNEEDKRVDLRPR